MLPIIGMSPGNSYFKDIEVAYLLKETIKKYNKAVILVADEPAISTYLAMGYNFSKARSKAILKGNNLKNRTKKVILDLGIEEENIIIVDWEEDIKNNKDYILEFTKVENLYKNNKGFNKSVINTSKEVLTNSGKSFEEKDIEMATHYLLSEIAFLEFAIKYFNEDKIAYVYHKNWKVFEDYIAGIFDNKIKQNLDFILLENPYEKYLLLDQKKSRFEKILDNKEIKITYSDYFDIFKDKGNGKYEGLFFNIINYIGNKEGLNLNFVEKSGYGIIGDRLNKGYADIFCSPVWPTKERKLDIFFSKSIFESNIFAYFNKNSKFINSKLEDLFLDKELRIVVKENDIHHNLAKKYFPNARLIWIPQLAKIEEILNFVKENRADMTFWDENLVQKYISKNKLDKDIFYKKGFGDKPITIYQNCFTLPWGEFKLKKLIDSGIEDFLLENNN